MDVLITIVQFLAVLAAVVLVHEFGHFATAKAFGVKVNEFGFGFPPKLLTVWRKGETAYTINLLPIGGFVKLEGENDATGPRSLASKGVGTRFTILVAGVFMNVVLALLLLTGLFMFTVGELEVAQVSSRSPGSEAGLLPGDRILKVNDEDVSGFRQLTRTLGANRGTDVPLLVRRDGSEQVLYISPASHSFPHDAGSGVSVEVVGDLEVLNVSPDSPADRAGVQVGDIITAVNGSPVDGFYALTGLINENRGRRIEWQVLRDGAPKTLYVTPRSSPAPGQGATGINIDVAGEVRVQDVAPGSPAHSAGLQPGDIIAEVDGATIRDFIGLSNAVDRRLGEKSTWTIQSGSASRAITLVPEADALPYEASTGLTVEFLALQKTPVNPPWEALARSVTWIGSAAVMTKDAVASWLSDDGEAPFAGPIGIAQGTGELAREAGLVSLIPLTALLSMSLAFFNILPIPALDGGKLVFVVLEWVRRGKRIPPEKEGLVHVIGFVGLMTMLAALTYNDIIRIIEGYSFLP